MVTPMPTGPSGGEPRPPLDASDVIGNTGDYCCCIIALFVNT